MTVTHLQLCDSSNGRGIVMPQAIQGISQRGNIFNVHSVEAMLPQGMELNLGASHNRRIQVYTA